MRYAVSYRERDCATLVGRTTVLAPGDIEETVTRIQSWAAIRGVQLARHPYLLLDSEEATVQIPVRGPEPEVNPQTGILLQHRSDGIVLQVTDVPLAEAHAVARQVLTELAKDCGAESPAEFHAGKDGFAIGTIVVPIRAMPREPRLQLVAAVAA